MAIVITRRAVLFALTGGAANRPVLGLPVHHVIDSRANCSLEQLSRFSSLIWAEAVRDFDRCGVRLLQDSAIGEIRRSPSGRPILTGLRRKTINLVLTRNLPVYWDRGRGLAGVSLLDEGRPVCILALDHAYPHRIPFLAVNTCVHELLHVIFNDVAGSRPSGVSGDAREMLIDLHATSLWLFHRGTAIREAAEACRARLGA